jgi:hypothetical protein
MERQYEPNDCPEPEMLPQVPAKFDREDDYSQDDDSRQCHICVTKESNEKKHG